MAAKNNTPIYNIAAPLTRKEWLVVSPGIFLVVAGTIALDSHWPYALWTLIAGAAYLAAAMVYVVRNP